MRKTGFVISMVVAGLFSVAPAFAGMSSECYRMVQNRLSDYDGQRMQEACRKIQSGSALGCVDQVLNHLGADDTARLIDACSTVNSEAALACVSDVYRSHDYGSFEGPIRECGKK